MTFEAWWKELAGNRPRDIQQYARVKHIGKVAWQAATERAAGIAKEHGCTCNALTLSMKPCLSCRIAQKIREEIKWD